MKKFVLLLSSTVIASMAYAAGIKLRDYNGDDFRLSDGSLTLRWWKK